MSETIQKLSFVLRDLFIMPEALEDKFIEVRKGYHCKIDMLINQIEHNITKESSSFDDGELSL